MIHIVILGTSSLVYVDESGIHKHYQRDQGRALRGVRIHGTKPGKRGKKTNVVAGLMGKKHVAVQCYDHSMTSEFFEIWFEDKLITAIPKGSVIILDNASFHRKKQLYSIAGKHGVYVVFLPPYSPDFNLIEKSWANLKRWLIDNLSLFSSLASAIEVYFAA
jgi:transposase